jgi:drug/metabolite transporter (DMT)-like permease
MTKTENNILLFSITLCWSASYIFIKSLPPDLSSFAYLTLITGIAALILSIIFIRQLMKVTRGIIKSAFVLSLLLTVNLLVEKQGIKLLPASNASFLSALTILIVPMLMLLLRVKPNRNNIAGAGIIVLGLCLTNRFALGAFISTGTLFMLLACLCSAVYIIAADRFTKKEDPLLIGVVQMIFTSITGFIMWTIETPTTFFSVNYTNELLSSIFILAFFTKAYAYIILMFSQKYTDPISVTIIASTEPVVTLMLAVLIPSAFGVSESLSYFSLIGAVIIAFGAVIAGSNYLKSKKSKHETEEAS